MPEHDTTFDSGIPIVKYTGSFTSLIPAPMPGIKEIVTAGYKKVIFDASGISYVNSQGLSSIINSHRFCNRENVLMVISGARPDVMKVIRVARATLFIPIYDTIQTALKEIKYTSGPSVRGKDREKILIIQNNIQLTTDLTDALTAGHQLQNYEILTKTSLIESLEFMKENDIQIVIIEVNFPPNEVEGFVAGMAMSPQLSVVPILVATPKSRYGEAFRFILNGVDDFLPHPFDEFETPTRLRSLLELYYVAKSESGGRKLSGLKASRANRSPDAPF
jgi:anti-anti-sigma factor